MRILLADPDAERAKVIAEACAAHGHVVDRAVHGAAALEVGLERVPNIVVCPIDLPIIDGARLSEILRSNPRTRDTSFVFLVEDELETPIGMDPSDRVALAPWREEDVVDQIEALVRHESHPPQVRTDSEIEGKLSQISLTDLLQIFQLNRKSGTIRISVEGASGAGQVYLVDGQVVDASVPIADGSRVGGEKALFRLLGARQGRFEFTPEEEGVEARINRPSRALLLEATRQMDEWEQLRDQLPAPETRVGLQVGREQVEADSPPLWREILTAVRSYRRIGDIVDHCSSPDYQVLRAIHDLLGRGVLAIQEPPRPSVPSAPLAAGGIFTPSQLRRLREWVTSQVPRPGPVLKVVALPADLPALEAFVAVLRECPDFTADGRLLRAPERLGGLGSLGRFGLGDGLQLRVIAVPGADPYAPAWSVAGHGMLGALVLLRPPVAPAAQSIERATEALRGVSARPIVYALATGGGAPTLGDLERDALERLGGGPLFALPTDPDPSRAAVLQNLFARLVP